EGFLDRRRLAHHEEIAFVLEQAHHAATIDGVMIRDHEPNPVAGLSLFPPRLRLLRLRPPPHHWLAPISVTCAGERTPGGPAVRAPHDGTKGPTATLLPSHGVARRPVR